MYFFSRCSESIDEASWVNESLVWNGLTSVAVGIVILAAGDSVKEISIRVPSTYENGQFGLPFCSLICKVYVKSTVSLLQISQQL